MCAALRAGAAEGADDQAPVLSWAAHYAASSNGRGLERVGLANATPLAGAGPRRGPRGRSTTSAAPRRWRRCPPEEAVDLGMDPRAIFAKAGRTRADR